MKFPVLLLSIARPVYTAPEAELSTMTWASVKLAFHAEMVPSRASKINNADDPWFRTKSFVEELKAMPVGVPLFVLPPAAGILTTNCLLPPLSYTSVRAEPELLIQNGVC